MRLRWSIMNPPVYDVLIGDGRIIRIPHEPYRKLEPDHPLATFDYASIERSLAEGARRHASNCGPRGSKQPKGKP